VLITLPLPPWHHYEQDGSILSIIGIANGTSLVNIAQLCRTCWTDGCRIVRDLYQALDIEPAQSHNCILILLHSIQLRLGISIMPKKWTKIMLLCPRAFQEISVLIRLIDDDEKVTNRFGRESNASSLRRRVRHWCRCYIEKMNM
jgi:hypothetical protein